MTSWRDVLASHGDLDTVEAALAKLSEERPTEPLRFLARALQHVRQPACAWGTA